MSTTTAWPTREEWIAKAEHSVRTRCYTSQWVSADPTAWATTDQLVEIRALAVAIVKATRTALTRVGRANERTSLNSYGRHVARDYVQVDELHLNCMRIITVARSVQAASDSVDRLGNLIDDMIGAREAAAEQAVTEAVAREVAKRSSVEGWNQELERRAQIDGGQHITFHRI